MRFVLLAAVALTLSVLVLGTFQTLKEGRTMRDGELIAAAHTESLMRAQEVHRTRDADVEDASVDGVLYGTFRELQDEGLIDGFELVDEDGTVLRRDGYLFRLKLLPSQNPASGVLRLGQRYEIWAWPEMLSRSSQVLYYASNAGYLIQGENGNVTGLSPILPSVNPLQELDDLQEKGITRARRWTVLKNIRESEVVGS